MPTIAECVDSTLNWTAGPTFEVEDVIVSSVFCSQKNSWYIISSSGTLSLPKVETPY